MNRANIGSCVSEVRHSVRRRVCRPHVVGSFMQLASLIHTYTWTTNENEVAVGKAAITRCVADNGRTVRVPDNSVVRWWADVGDLKPLLELNQVRLCVFRVGIRKWLIPSPRIGLWRVVIYPRDRGCGVVRVCLSSGARDIVDLTDFVLSGIVSDTVEVCTYSWHVGYHVVGCVGVAVGDDGLATAAVGIWVEAE